MVSFQEHFMEKCKEFVALVLCHHQKHIQILLYYIYIYFYIQYYEKGKYISARFSCPTQCSRSLKLWDIWQTNKEAKMRFCGVFSFCSRYRDVLLMAAQEQHELHHERQESATVLGSGNYKNPGEPYFTLNWEYCSHEKRCKYGTSLPACQLAILPAWPLILSLCY